MRRWSTDTNAVTQHMIPQHARSNSLFPNSQYQNLLAWDCKSGSLFMLLCILCFTSRALPLLQRFIPYNRAPLKALFFLSYTTTVLIQTRGMYNSCLTTAFEIWMSFTVIITCAIPSDSCCLFCCDFELVFYFQVVSSPITSRSFAQHHSL